MFYQFMTAYEIYRDEFKRLFPGTDVPFFLKKPIPIKDLVETVKKEAKIS